MSKPKAAPMPLATIETVVYEHIVGENEGDTLALATIDGVPCWRASVAGSLSRHMNASAGDWEHIAEVARYFAEIERGRTA